MKVFPDAAAEIKKRPMLILLVSLVMVLLLAGCAGSPPAQVSNICGIFDEKGGFFNNWHKAAKKASKRHGVPIHILMATMHQESKFSPKAKPPRKKLLGFIPWKRPSSAFGYAQVLDGTWKHYKKKSGANGADRDKFKDAVEFVAWYHENTSKRNKVSKWDSYNLYLAYHEGNGGFAKKSYNKKPWLLTVAKKVDSQAKKYSAQYKKCEKRLNRPWWLPF